MNKGCLILIVTLLSNLLSVAQSSKWSDHFSYRNASHVAETETYVAVSSEMGLMLLNKLNQDIRTFSKVNGLSDVDITALQSISDDRFIIGYANGNIDVVSTDLVYNIPDFKLKQIQGAKQINHFYSYNDKVYCSTDYALLVIDVNKREISDTYFLGYNAESLAIYQTVIDSGDLYAATDRGLLKADLSDPLIVYDEGWNLISTSSVPHFAVNLHEGSIVSVSKINNNYQCSYLANGQWSNIKTSNRFSSLSVYAGKMVLSLLTRVEVYNENFNLAHSIDDYTFDDNVVAQSVIYSSFEEAYFIADSNYGIVMSSNDEDVHYLANGPYSNNCFDLHATSTGVYSTAGGLTAIYNNLNRPIEYSYFNNESWDSYKSTTPGNGYTSRDLIRITSSSVNDTVYMCSWGGGIYEIEGVNSITHFDETNSGLQDIYPDTRKYVRVGGIASDSKGNIWMSNAEVDAGVVIKSGSEWHRMNYDTTDDVHSTGQFLITKDDIVWIPIPMSGTGDKHGIMVINPNGTLLDDSDDQYKSGLVTNDPRNAGQFQLWDEDRNVITKLVLSMAEDKNGYVWFGTDKGVLVNYRPWAIFSEDYPVTSRIKVPRNDGSNLADYLLEEERVSCIAVDGANRKWIGTEASGIYLVSEDGLKTYQSFNVDNSPLPSNTITSIAISPVSGEVFIGTAKGIVSYKAKATEGDDSFNKIYAYPNPVREDFAGDITITGLIENSNVKITTVSGKLVHETKSLGGKAYWNGTNLVGEKVKTGVYLVYVSAEDGGQSAVTKILIVR